jgi:hypothetical protein
MPRPRKVRDSAGSDSTFNHSIGMAALWWPNPLLREFRCYIMIFVDLEIYCI